MAFDVDATPSRKSDGRRGARESVHNSDKIWRLKGLTRGLAAEHISRGQVLRRERGLEKVNVIDQLTRCRIENRNTGNRGTSGDKIIPAGLFCTR